MLGLARWLLWSCILGGSKRMMISGSRSLQATSQLTLDDAMLVVQEAPCSPLNASLEGELVHLVCPVSYNGLSLGDSDPLLQSTPVEQRTGLRLEAYMEVYSWDEFQYTKKVGKRNVRDYLYFREFLPTTPTRNTSFSGQGSKCRVDNGGRPCYQWIPAEIEPWWNSSGYQLGWTTVDTVQNITLGGSYVIPSSGPVIDNLVELAGPQALQPACIMDGGNEEGTPCAAATLQSDSRTVAWQQMDSNDETTDYLTRYYNLYTVDFISVLAVQRGRSFEPWESVDGQSLFEFVPGSRTAAQMIEAAKSSAPGGRIGTTSSTFFGLVGLFLSIIVLAA